MKLFKLLSIAFLLSFGIKGAEQKEDSEGIVLTKAQVEEGIRRGEIEPLYRFDKEGRTATLVGYFKLGQYNPVTKQSDVISITVRN